MKESEMGSREREKIQMTEFWGKCTARGGWFLYKKGEICQMME